jgi:predicted MFS family arabinose efflux permease
MEKNLLSPRVLWVMTVSAGACAANLYYCQPLLHEMQKSFGATDDGVGLVATCTQVGYAVGMLFLVPLGDRGERRRLIVGFTLASALALCGLAVSSSLNMAVWLSLAVGLCTMTPQLLIPFAANLAPEKQRGQVVGTVMSGLLIGILMARTVAGFLGAAFGWRMMFGIAAIGLTALALVLRLVLPKSEPSYRGSYLALLKSVWTLVIEQPDLREAMLFGAALFAAFSAFWATLVHLMATPRFNLGSEAVGLFGLVGVAGALAAPWVGKFADRQSPRRLTGTGIAVAGVAYVLYWVWGNSSLVGLTVGVLIMDVGVQMGHVANQSRVFGILPSARSRLNTAYMFSYFLGGAIGSALGTWAWSRFEWSGVCAVGLGFLGLGGLFYAL